MRNGRYLPPTMPGYSAEMWPRSIADHEFPGGAVWRDAAAT
jgi:L-fuconate dehydratase